jgi:hypothetical protein
MNLSKEVLLDLKATIAYYQYKFLKSDQVMIKVFKCRYDDDTKEPYLNELDAELSGSSLEELSAANTVLSVRHNLQGSENLIIIVAINSSRKIHLMETGELAIWHNSPKKVHPNLLLSRNYTVAGDRPELEPYVPKPSKSNAKN